MLNQTKTTTNHNEIKDWTEKNGGKPAIIGNPKLNPNIIALKVSFPERENNDFLSEAMKPSLTSWNKFFEIFDKKNLAFIYEEQPKSYDISLSYRFIKKENELLK